MNHYVQYTTWDNPKDTDRPLIVGYVSPDYFTHSVSYFIEAPLSHHDYANYKVVVYSAVVKVKILLFLYFYFSPYVCLVKSFSLHLFLVDCGQVFSFSVFFSLIFLPLHFE